MLGVPFAAMRSVNMDKPENKQDWNDFINILIAYHMARIYGEDKRQKVINVCAIITTRTKSPALYDLCMRVVRGGTNESIEKAIGSDLGLQGVFDRTMRLKDEIPAPNY